MSRVNRAWIAWLLCVPGGAGLADQLPVLPIGAESEYPVDSGEWANPGGDEAVLFAEEISLPGAAWLRLYFDDIQLNGASFIRLTSLLDGQQQALDAADA